MRVGIDLTCWGNRRGYGRFTRSLVPALLDLESEHRFVLLVDRPTAEATELPAGAERIVVPTRRAQGEAAAADSSRSLRDLWAMSGAVARERFDAFFFPSVYSYFPPRRGPAVLLGVHDVIAEDYPELVFPHRLRRLLWTLKSRLAHRRADFVVAVSHFSKAGILRHFHHPPDRVWVVEEAPDPAFRPLPAAEVSSWLSQRLGLDPGEPFLAYLGGVNPHKNLGALAEALAALRRRPGLAALRLVLVGDVSGDRFTPGLAAFQQRLAALDLAAAVTFAGFLEDADVARLLNGAAALVLPSRAEGFGLPAVEAAACGTPVVATRNSPLPDLLAGGGFFVDPRDTAGLTEALARLLGDPRLRRQMGAAAREAARRLTWNRSAQQMIDLLAEVERIRR